MDTEENDIKTVTETLEATKDPQARIALIGRTLENLAHLQELRKKQTELMDQMRFMLEWEREMLKLGLNVKDKWHLIPRGHVNYGSVSRRMVEHTKWHGSWPADIVGCSPREGNPLHDERFFFELPIKPYSGMKYHSMGYGSVVEPKGAIYGFGAPPKPKEEE